MSTFLWNLLLAFLWAALSDDLSLANVLIGFALGFVILGLMRKSLGIDRYFRKAWLGALFIPYIFVEIVKASARITFDVWTPRHRMLPGVIAVPLEARTDLEITHLANLVSLTPGTLCIDVSDDRRCLFVHAMYIRGGDVETMREEVKRMERRLLEVLR